VYKSIKPFQVEKKQGDLVKPKSTLKIRKHLDGSISAWSHDKELEIHAIDSRQKQEPRKPIYKKKTYKNIKPLSWKQMNQLFFK